MLNENRGNIYKFYGNLGKFINFAEISKKFQYSSLAKGAMDTPDFLVDSLN